MALAPLAPGSWLAGSARQLQRDQLATYERALAGFGGRPVRFHLGPPRVGFEFTVVFQPEDARRVLATDAAHYDKGVPIIDEFRRVLGEGLITSDGDRWRRDRRLVAPIFTPKQVASYTPTMAAAAERMVDGWANATSPTVQLDLHDAALHYTLAVLGATVFGDDVGTTAGLFTETVPSLSEYVTKRGLAPVKIPASWPTPANRRAAKAIEGLFAVVDGLIARRRGTPTSGSDHAQDLLGRLLAARDPDTGETLDDVAVRDQALTFLVAGHETTASCLALTLDLLGRHPALQARVREEVLASGAGSTFELDRLTYTHQVAKEALRLYPPGHTVVRRALKDCEVAGYAIPTGHVVAVSVYGIHHNPAVWPDPHRFDPDRFAGDGHGLAPAEVARYAHLPFGGGPRGCIGAQFALAEIAAAVAAVVGRYHVEVDPRPVSLDVGASIRPRGSLVGRLQPV